MQEESPCFNSHVKTATNMKNKPNVTAIDELENAEESNSTNLPKLSNSVSPSSVPTTLNNEGFWDQENREIQSNGSYEKPKDTENDALFLSAIFNIENFNIDQSNRFAIGSLDKQVLLLALFRSLFA